ncbi:MAG: hypothetical protein HYY45_14025, partial [Deltaproteobacteria bacterium]|nr:hypothetical protein [Deltaproteobacteria bacterium]
MSPGSEARLGRILTLLDPIRILLLVSPLILTSTPQAQQDRTPVSIKVLLDLQKKISCRQLATTVAQRGIGFDLTEEVKERLRKAQVCEDVIAAAGKEEEKKAREKAAKIQGHIELGRGHLAQQRHNEAVAEFEKARALDPANEEAKTLLERAEHISRAEASLEGVKTLSLDAVEQMLLAGFSSQRIINLIEERGTNFEVSADARKLLRLRGADEQVLEVLGKKGEEYALRKLADEERKAEEMSQRARLLIDQAEELLRQAERDKTRAAAEKRRLERKLAVRAEEERRRKTEEKKRMEELARLEDKRKQEEERRKAEELARAKAEEERRRLEELARLEEKRKEEEEKKRSEEERRETQEFARKRAEEEKKRLEELARLEVKKKQEEETKQLAEEQRRLEERQKREGEGKRLEEERRKAEELARAKAEEERRRLEELARL